MNHDDQINNECHDMHVTLVQGQPRYIFYILSSSSMIYLQGNRQIGLVVGWMKIFFKGKKQFHD